MQLLNWSMPGSCFQGTIGCKDGHILLPEVTRDEKPRWERIIRLFTDTLDAPPPFIADVTAHFKELGIPSKEWNGHTAFGPLPEGVGEGEPVPDYELPCGVPEDELPQGATKPPEGEAKKASTPKGATKPPEGETK